MATSLDPLHPEPLYQQLANAIVKLVATGQIRPGDELPSIRQLEALYGVSNTTVRRALSVLQQRGYAYSLHGKGTFVSDRRIDKPLGPWASFSDDMRRQGITPSSMVLRADLTSANGSVAEALDLLPGDEVVVLERTRMGDGVPMCVQVCYLPHALCPELLRYDFARCSLYEVLQRKYRLVMGTGWYTIWAALAGSRELRCLELTTPAVVLWIEHRNALVSGQVIEYARTAYRADRYQVQSTRAAVSLSALQ